MAGEMKVCGPLFSHTCIPSTVLPAIPEAALCTAVGGGTIFQHSSTENIKPSGG